MVTKKAYRPQEAKPWPWQDIEQWYIKFGKEIGKEIQIQHLVSHIIKTGLDERLFGATSHLKLIISIYNPIDYTREALHIDFDMNYREWHFAYFGKPNTYGVAQPEFERKYPEEQGIEKFDSFINMVKW